MKGLLPGILRIKGKRALGVVYASDQWVQHRSSRIARRLNHRGYVRFTKDLVGDDLGMRVKK